MNKSKPQFQLFIGIDVAKGKADASILQVFPDRSRKDKMIRKKLKIEFSKSGIDSFHQTVLNYVDEYCISIQYALEDTGIYYRNFYDYFQTKLSDQETILVLKPSYVSQWCKLHERSKSDPLDAQSIAQIIAYERDYRTIKPAFSNEKREYSDLRAAVRRYDQLQKISSQESTRLIGLTDIHCPELAKALGNGMTFLQVLAVYPSTYDIIHSNKQDLLELIQSASKKRFGEDKVEVLLRLCEDSLNQREPSDTERKAITSLVHHLLALKEELSQLKADMKKLCEQIPGYNSLVSMPGMGITTIAYCLAEIMDIHRFKNADALIAYAGTDPVNRRSGASVHSEGKISRNGSRYLRHAVVIAAEFARRHNPVLAELFKRLKAGQRKRHFLALIAVANKLLRYIYSVLKNEEEFVINFKDLSKLKEETRISFFQNITTEIPKGSLKQIYRYEDEFGEIHPFVYIAKNCLLSPAE